MHDFQLQKAGMEKTFFFVCVSQSLVSPGRIISILVSEAISEPTGHDPAWTVA